MKKKKPKIKTLTNKLWKIFSYYIRLRDCLRTTGKPTMGHCISCGRLYPIEKLQAGHFISGRQNANLFHEKGCHAQCIRCNIFLSGNVLEYMDAMIRLYGKKVVNELRKNNTKSLSFTIEYLEDKIIEFKRKTKELVDKGVNRKRNNV